MTDNQQELITVVIPVFNVRDYLDRCLESVLAQDYRNLQVVLVDDGSTDGSGETCDAYADLDPRVEVVHTANSGLSAARNAGVTRARGSCVLFVDSDDTLAERHVSNLYGCLQKCDDPSTAVAVTGFTPVERSVAPFDVQCANEFVALTAAEAISESVTIGGRFAAHAWGKLYSMALFGLLHYPVGRFYEDQFVTYKIFLEASEVAYENADDYFYTTDRPGSISVGSRVRELDYLDAIRGTLADVERFCIGAVPAVKARYLAALIYGVETACLDGSPEMLDPLYEEAFLRKGVALGDVRLSLSDRIKFSMLAIGKKCFAAAVKLRLGAPRPVELAGKVRRRLAALSKSKMLSSVYDSSIDRSGGPVSFLVMTPRYRNYGDQLIAFSEHLLLEEAKVNVMEVSYEDCQDLGCSFAELLADGESVFFTGGGYLGDLWLGLESTAEKLLKTLGERNSALFFPVSVYYEGDCSGRFEAAVSASKAPIVVCAREAVTCERLTASLSCIEPVLPPDVGLFVRRSDLMDHAPTRVLRSALVCIRHDKESLQSVGFGIELTAALSALGMSISAVDTHDPIGETAPEHRREELSTLARRFGEASLVVTNRLHGMVFAMIMGTPVVVLDNVSGKVSGVAKWVAGRYPLVITDEANIAVAVAEAAAFLPYKGDVADLLMGERERLVLLIGEVMANG